MRRGDREGGRGRDGEGRLGCVAAGRPHHDRAAARARRARSSPGRSGRTAARPGYAPGFRGVQPSCCAGCRPAVPGPPVPGACPGLVRRRGGLPSRTWRTGAPRRMAGLRSRRGRRPAPSAESSAATRSQRAAQVPWSSRGGSPAGAPRGARTVLGMETCASTVSRRNAPVKATIRLLLRQFCSSFSRRNAMPASRQASSRPVKQAMSDPRNR